MILSLLICQRRQDLFRRRKAYTEVGLNDLFCLYWYSLHVCLVCSPFEDFLVRCILVFIVLCIKIYDYSGILEVKPVVYRHTAVDDKGASTVLTDVQKVKLKKIHA